MHVSAIDIEVRVNSLQNRNPGCTSSRRRGHTKAGQRASSISPQERPQTLGQDLRNSAVRRSRRSDQMFLPPLATSATLTPIFVAIWPEQSISGFELSSKKREFPTENSENGKTTKDARKPCDQTDRYRVPGRKRESTLSCSTVSKTHLTDRHCYWNY